MKSIPHGKNISGVRVTNINKHGIWLITRDHELFISFKEFPWFQDTTLRKLMRVEQLTPTCLHWSDPGIDLAVESVRCFPLVSPTPRPTARSGRQSKIATITEPKSDLRTATRRTLPREPNTTSPRIPHLHNPISHVKGEEGGTAHNT
jgi:hypothetical protein